MGSTLQQEISQGDRASMAPHPAELDLRFSLISSTASLPAAVKVKRIVTSLGAARLSCKPLTCPASGFARFVMSIISKFTASVFPFGGTALSRGWFPAAQ